jgi:chaperonin GroEL
MAKQTIFGKAAREALVRGVDAVVNPVKVTLGPRGLNVMMARPGQPVTTRDGVTVAKEVSDLPDPYENMGALMAREVADAAVTEAGDGTTTASVLLQAIVRGGMKAIEAGAEPLALADGIGAAAAHIVEALKAQAIPATPELVRKVAIISTHGDVELGTQIAEMTQRVGLSGVVELAESQDAETHAEYVEGYYFERGWFPNSVFAFAAGPQQKVVLDNPVILVSERVLVASGMEAVRQGAQGDYIARIVEACAQHGRHLLIIADDLTGDAFNLITANLHGGILRGACFVKLPGFGPARAEAVRDLQIAIGAKRIHSQASQGANDQLSSFTLADLGTCKQAIISPTRTVLVGGGGEEEKVHKRVQYLQGLAKDSTNLFDKQTLELRIARLAGGVAVLKVGAHSEPALIEKKARAEDAIHACRGAMEQGVVTGGGTALLRAGAQHEGWGWPINIGGKGGQGGTYQKHYNGYPKGVGDPLDKQMVDYHKGYQILLDAVQEPATHIVRNAGIEPETVAEIVKSTLTSGSPHKYFGYDAAKGEHCDLMERGVVDPVKVVITAVSKAASVGALMLTTDTLISDIPEGTAQLATPRADIRTEPQLA